MSEFRDALAVALSEAWADTITYGFKVEADAILDTPEMQALRLIARHNLADWCCDECRNAYADEHDIPMSVIEWVLS